MKVKNTSTNDIFYPTISGFLGAKSEKTVTVAEGEVYLTNEYVVEVQDSKPKVKKED